MSNTPSQEVQLLLSAEKKALEKVSDARSRKMRRLKQAKEEAAAEIEEFKAEKEIQFHKYETEHMGSKDEVARRIDRDAASKLSSMKSCISESRHVILEKLVNQCIHQIDVRLHKNQTISVN